MLRQSVKHCVEVKNHVVYSAVFYVKVQTNFQVPTNSRKEGVERWEEKENFFTYNTDPFNQLRSSLEQLPRLK